MNKIRIKTLISIFLLLGQVPVFAQAIDKEKAIEDLYFLTDNIKKYNPALKHYNPNFDRLSIQVINNLDRDSISIYEHFTEVSRICALANEGHFNLGDWSDIVHKGLLDNSAAYLPIEIKLISNQLYIWEDYSNEQKLKKGDKILSINGIKTETILAKLLAVTPSDGNITTYAYRKIEDSFPFAYFFYIQQTDVFKIKLLNQSSEEKTIGINALVRSEQVDNYKKYYASKTSINTSNNDGFYHLTFESDYALLTLPSFDFRRVNKFDVKAKKLYKTIFEELQEKNVKNLVFDLRNNTGGRNEFADAVVPFILKSSNSEAYLKKTISWEGKRRIYKMPKQSKLVFEGPIYVLVNGKTYSAGSSLARFLKEYANATLIGPETGTRYEGFAGGSAQDVILPNSQIKIGIPRYHFLYPASRKQSTINKGLLPDFYISYSFQDILNNVDLHLEKVISLIGNEEK